MADTINNFLVGLGFKYDDSGVKKFNSSLGTIRSKALQLGAVLGLGLGAKDLLFDIPEQAEQLGVFAKQIGSTAEKVNTLNMAMKLVGGTASDSQASLESLNNIRTGSIQEQAEFLAKISQQQLPTQIGKDIINAKDSYQAYINVINDGNKLTNEQQIRLANVLGLSKKIVLQMRESPKSFAETLNKISKINPAMNELAETSESFNNQWSILKERVSGIGNSISNEMLPPLTKGLSMLNKFIEKNPETTKAISTGTSILGGAAAVGIGSKVLKATGAMTFLPETAAVVGATGLGLAAGHKFSTDDMPGSDFGTFQDTLTSFAKDYNKTHLKMINSNNNNTKETQPQDIHLSIILDGETIEKKVLNITNKERSQALSDMESTVRS